MTLGQDVRYGLRVLRKHPGFTLAAAMSLALGIGATTAIFSVANATLLRTLPYREPGRLATISVEGSISAPLAETFRHEARSIERAALFVNWSFNLAGRGEPQRIPGARVSASLFGLLGIPPRLGRAFTAEEDQLGRDRVVVISDGLWKREFGGDAGVVGRGVILNGAPYTIIGVMPPGFQFPDGPELPFFVGSFPPAEMWRPMALENWERTCGGCFNFGMLARLRRGVTPAAARAEMRGIMERQAKGKTSSDSEGLTVRTLEEAVTGKVRTPVLILLGAVTLALLIACVNVANLLVARGLGRQGEIAVRLSLGATRGRVARQLLTEAAALAVCAAGLAIPLAWAGIRGLVAMAPAGIPGIETAGLDARMLAFALGVGLVTALMFGAAPAAMVSRRAPGEVLKAGGRTATGAPSRLRAALVVAECALALVLLIGSGLLAQSFLTVARTPLGFHAENVLTMRTVLPDTKYDERRRVALVEQMASSCGALPGVMAAAAVSTLPLTGESEGWGVIAEDSPDPNNWVMLRARAVTPGYFRTLGIRMRGGRDFAESDPGENPVAILSESGARKLWPGVTDPLGRRINSKPPITVVGIVDDTRASGLDTEVRPYIYVPFRQFAPEESAMAVRSAADPAKLAAAVKSEIWRMDKDQPVTHVAVMKQLVADSIAPRRFQAVLMTLFGAFALVLAAVGIYGVLAYSVAQRTHEIGIRMALGASRLDVLASVIRQASGLALAGTALGLAAAWLLTPLLRSLLYGVGAAEVSIYAWCALVLLGVAALAGIVPARRAAGLDPMVCLRYE